MPWGRSAPDVLLYRVLMLVAGFMTVTVASCDSSPGARAFRVDDRVQLIGGPAAIGELGDFVIENDRIRAVVLQGGNSVGPGMFGGTIVDVDIRRTEENRSAGRGFDQFSELFPMVNLVIPGYQDEQSYGIGDLEVSILSDGSNGRCPLTEEEAPEGCAAIRVAGRGDRLIEALGTVELLGVEMDFSFISYYILRPGDSYIWLRTFFWHDGRWSPDQAGFEPGADDEPTRLMELSMSPDAGTNYETLLAPEPIFVALLGDAMATDPASLSPYHHPGLLAGDFLLFGKDVTAFGTSTLDSQDLAPDRSGFDTSYLFQRRYDRGEVVLERPLANTVIVGVGDSVSYGYMSGEGSVVIPILTSSFTGTFTHRYQCITENNSQDCGDELARPLYYDRFLVVGEGDAASVLDSYYDLNGTTTGRISGNVFDELTGDPVEHARVFALLDPRSVAPEADISSYEAASEALRNIDFDGDGEPDENPSILSFAATDTGIDHVPDASYDLRLEPGDYLLVAFVKGRRPGRPVAVTVVADQHDEVAVPLSPAGRFYYEIFDDRGEHATAKLTLIGPLDDDAECPVDFRDPSSIAVLSELRYLELGMGERPQQVATVLHSQSGQGHVDVAPGRYDVIASRGFEYSIDRRCIDIRHDTAPVEPFMVIREVDTTGWVAGDFHVHGVNSYDGNMDHDARIISSVAEGIEVFSTTDHDYLTNLTPIIYDMNMRDEVHAMVGIEVTPIELGHLLGYPLRFDETAVDNGAIDWTRRGHCLEFPEDFGCPESDVGFMSYTPDELFELIRDLGEFGPDHTVVTVPHPRDGFFGYFDQYALNHFDLTLDSPGLIRGQNPLLADFPQTAPVNERFRLYSERFDAIELFNGNRYEYIRTPTVGEVTSFAQEVEAATASATSDDEFAQSLAAIHDHSIRQVLVRTPREQELMRHGREWFIRCLVHDDCEAGEICDPHRRQCVSDPGPCATREPCPDAAYYCEPNVVTGADSARCLQGCTSNDECRLDEYCVIEEGETIGACAWSRCNIAVDGSTLPEEEADEDPERPCVRNEEPHSEGVVDDWFRLLNYGVAYTGMGNSDTHTPASEIGLPRNYIQSSVDAPAMIDRREIADNIRGFRVVSSYGPFIEVSAAGGVIGDTVAADGPVELRVRVQSPSWFDVDRLEVYANGELLCDLGHLSEAPCNTEDELAVGSDGLNTNIVNFDGVIIDDPAIDTWYVVVAMGVSEQARGLSPVYFATIHPHLGFSEVIGQAFASFDVPILSTVILPPVTRAYVNLMVPYAITNPIWVESNHDDDERWTPPLGLGDPDDPDARGLPAYRRATLCQHSIEQRGCLDQPLMPLSTESLGIGENPLVLPEEDADTDAARLRRINMIRRALSRLTGGGC